MRIDIVNNAFDEAAKWSLTDFTEEAKSKLKKALESGEDFETYYNCRKEPSSAEIYRQNGTIWISVTVSMDDLFDSCDLVSDAMWEVLGDGCELATDEDVEAIQDMAICAGLTDSTTAEGWLPGDCTFDELCKKIDELEQSASEENDLMFRDLCNIVRGYYDC